jgi:hypothetical protein
MNGKRGTCRLSNAFALMYRRANTTFYEGVKFEKQKKGVAARALWRPKGVGLPNFAHGTDEFVQILLKVGHIIRVQTPLEHIS